MWAVLRVVDVFKTVPHVSVKSVHLTEAAARQSAGDDPEHIVVRLK